MSGGIWESYMHVPVGLVVVRRIGRILKANGAFCQLIGYSEAQLISMKLADLTHPEDLERDAEMTRQLFAGEIPVYAMEMRYICKDGSAVWVMVTGTVLRRDEIPLCSVRIAQDITQRLQVEAALQESVETFHKLCEASMDGVLIHDHVHIVLANQALAKMFQYEPSEIGSMAPSELFAPESRDWVLQHFTARNGQTFEAKAVRKDGTTFPIRMRVKAVVHHGRRMRLTAVQDRSVAAERSGPQASATEGRGAKPLSPREREVFRMVIPGLDNLQIARILGISRRTDKHNVSHILTKLDAPNRTAAVLAAHRSGLLDEIGRWEATHDKS